MKNIEFWVCMGSGVLILALYIFRVIHDILEYEW